MSIEDVNFLEIVGTWDRNFLVTMANFREEFDLMGVVDALYKHPVRLGASELHAVHVMQYMFAHSHFYEAWDHLMRCRLSGALMATRAAIDAALTCYKFLDDDSYVQRYVDSDPYFRTIKNNIDQQVKNGKFPLAQRLVHMHFICSKTGGHADLASFPSRVLISDGQVSAVYSQLAGKDGQLRQWFYFVIIAFCDMLRIFEGFLVHQSGAVDPAWRAEVDRITAIAVERGKALMAAQLEECE